MTAARLPREGAEAAGAGPLPRPSIRLRSVGREEPAAGAASRWLDALRTGRLAARAGARRLLLAAALFSAGALAGLVAGRVSADAPGHQEGACIALRTAAALGYLDDRQRRMVAHMLATAVNPDVDLFPGGHRAMQQACENVGWVRAEGP